MLHFAARMETALATWVRAMAAALDGDSREALFAHCVSLSINAVYEAWNRRPRAMAHADRLARALSLDMVTAGWVAPK